MNMSIERSLQKTVVKLEDDLTIYAVAELKAVVLDLISSSNEIEMDLADVLEFDSAALQVLALAKRTANLSGKIFRISAHSNSVVNLLELYDLVGFFGDPVLLSIEDVKPLGDFNEF